MFTSWDVKQKPRLPSVQERLREATGFVIWLFAGSRFSDRIVKSF